MFPSCHNKISYTGWLKPQEFIFLECWRLEVQDQGANIVLSVGSSLLSCRWLLTVFPHGRDTERASKVSGVSSYKDINATPVTSPILTYLPKTPPSKSNTLGVTASTYELQGSTHIFSTAPPRPIPHLILTSETSARY